MNEDLLKIIKVQNENGSYSDPIKISTDGDYIECYNGKDLNTILREMYTSISNAIDSDITFYYLASNLDRGVTTGTQGWTNSIQTMTNQKRYLWMYFSYKKIGGGIQRTDPVIIGVRGADGSQGQAGQDGASGVVINSTTITYGKSTSALLEPSSWGSEVPDLSKGDWLWVKTVYRYSNNNTQTTYTKSYIGTDGEDGTSVNIQSSSKVGKATTITFTDGSTMIINDGQDGPNGTPGAQGYVHIAWANSANGIEDFSTSESQNKKYIGVYSDNTQADSQLPGKYSWSLIKGAKGQDGTGIINTSILYGKSSSEATEPTDWFSTIPLLSNGDWLWTKTTYIYSDTNTYTSYSKSYIGTDGSIGKGISSIQPQYYLSDSPNALTGGTGWSTSFDYLPGKYIWTREYITYDDGTEGTSTPVYDEALTQSCIDAAAALNIANNTIQYFWNTERATYILTQDVEVDSDKVYYEFANDTYTAVVPIGDQDPSEQGWYQRFDDTGVHITQIPQEDFILDPENGGGNLLARTNGIAVRDGLDELATFGANGARIGKNDSEHITINSAGVNIYGGDGTEDLAEFGTEGVRVGSADSANFNITPASTYAQDVNGNRVFEIYSGGDEEQANYSESRVRRTSENQNVSISLQNPNCVDGQNIVINIVALFAGNASGNPNPAVCNLLYSQPAVGETLTETNTVRITNSIISTTSSVFTCTGTYTQPTEGKYNTTISISATTPLALEQVEYTCNYTSYRTLKPSYTLGTRRSGDPRGDYSVAEGNVVMASGKFSHAEGDYTVASGTSSHAEGDESQATGPGSHAEGNRTQAKGMISHAEGNFSIASGTFSHAEGDRTQASGTPSHAEGDLTQASGSCSHSEGALTRAFGNHSHAEGLDTEASGAQSHASGFGTIAAGENQTAIGKYNAEDTNNQYAFIIGNGVYGTPSNAFAVYWNGNFEIQGSSTTATLDTNYVTAGSITAYRRGNMVQLSADVTVNALSARTTIATLPVGYRPVAVTYAFITSMSEYAVITDTGGIQFNAGAAGRRWFSAVYVYGS